MSDRPKLPPHLFEELRRDLPPASFLFFFEEKQEEGIAACEEWIERAPQDAQAYATRGSMHSVREQPNLALLFFDRAIALGDQTDTVYLSRARAKIAARRPADAIADLEHVIEADRVEKSFGYYPYLLLADCLRRLNRTREALQVCDRIPDDYTFPGFGGLINGSKFTVIEKINKAPFADPDEDENED